MAKYIDTFSHITPRYESYLFDIWGVIHNGSNLYPGVLDVLRQLSQQRKSVYFVSNSPKLGKDVRSDLLKMGIDESLYKLIYTAGDSFYTYLQSASYMTNDQQRWFVLDHNNVSCMRELLSNMNQCVVDSYLDANNIVISSIDEFDLQLETYAGFVDFCKRKSPNIFSTNPDLHVITSKGRRARPGLLTRKLEKLGVAVRQYGKPEVSIFEEVLKKTPYSKKQHLMIGDSLNTDILGANNVGIDSLLLYGATSSSDAIAHYEAQSTQFSVNSKSLGINDVLEALQRLSLQPTYYLERLKI